MKHFSFIQLAIVTLLAMTVLHTTNASAKAYYGKIVLKVGETADVEAVPTGYGYIASGSFKMTGSCFYISARGSYSCSIRGISVGKGTLSYWGAVAPPNSWTTDIYDIYWDIEVVGSDPDPIPVTKISLSPSSTSLKVGETKQISATVSPSNATDKSVSWSTSNSNVATVSSGLVTAQGAGSAIITCRANDGSGVKAICNVTVSEPVTISINSTNFPDANFRNWLLEQDYGKDGVLTGDEIKNITRIDVDRKNISSLKGIELFTALKYLYCDDNQLTALDVSKNTALTDLWCQSNQLKALDVSKNMALTCLFCGSNQLTTLDVSKNTALMYLDCYNNQLTVLNVSENNKALQELRCTYNKIKGTEMDKLISSLPQNTTSDTHRFYAVDPGSKNEGNVCTKTQVAAVKAKGWTPQYYTSKGWVEYEGSDPTSISSVGADSEDVPVYTLSGQRLAAPRKGINIVGGKKVIIR